MIEKLERKIKIILETYPECRDDNNILIKQMLVSIYGLHQRGYESAYKYFPNIESVLRARRTLQAKYSHLRASEPVLRRRKRAQERYIKKYAKKY